MTTAADRIEDEINAELLPDYVIDEVGVPGHVDVCAACWQFASECWCYPERPQPVTSDTQQVA